MSSRSPRSGSSDSSSSPRTPHRTLEPGQRADAQDLQLRSYQVGALPIINRLLQRMRLREILSEQLPPDDPRLQLSTVTSLLVLLRNVLLSRQPVYGVAEWAARFAPDLLELRPEDVALLHDDRLGHALDRLFDRVGPQLILAVVRQVVQEFAVGLDELHNDSTSISFFGAYEEAQQESSQRGRATHAITWGHSKDHRPDLKQLLYILTISEDGGVPVYFTTASGNQTDDRTHCQTWDLLHQLVGRPEFLYVADCKLASSENLAHIATRGGRFVTVMPRTHKEDEVFRARLRQTPPTIAWKQLYEVLDDQGELRDRFSTCAQEQTSADGYRLLWYHSTRKAQLDASARNRRLQRAWAELADLQARLTGPRTRYRQRGKVDEAVARLLEDNGVAAWLRVTIEEQSQESYRQTRERTPDQRHALPQGNAGRLHAELGIEPAALDRSRARGRRVSLAQQRPHLRCRASVAGLQASAVDRKAVLAIQDRLCRGAGVLEECGPHPGAAGGVLPGAAGADLVRAGTASRDGPQ